MATLAMGVPLLGEEGFWKVPGWNGYYVYMCQGHACTARHGWRRVTRYAYTSRGDLKPDGRASGTGRIYCPSCAQELGLPMRQDALERDINDSTWITVTPEMLRAHLAQTSPMCLRSPAPTPWAILDAPAAQASPALRRRRARCARCPGSCPNNGAHFARGAPGRRAGHVVGAVVWGAAGAAV
jgi:hypothetical protein